MGLPAEDAASAQLLNQLLNDTSSARNTRVHNWIEEQYDFALTEHAAAEADKWTLDEDGDDASQFSYHYSRAPSPVPSSSLGADRAFSLSIDRPDSPVIPEHAARLGAEADPDALQADLKTPTTEKPVHYPRSRKEPTPSYDDLFFPCAGRQMTEEERQFEAERNRALKFLVKEMAGWGLDVGNRSSSLSTRKSPRTPKKERGRRPPPPTPHASSTSESPRLIPRLPSFTNSVATSSPSTVPTALVDGQSSPPSHRASAHANKLSESPEQSGEHIGLAPAAVITQKPRRPRAASDARVLEHHHKANHVRVPTSSSGDLAKSRSSQRQSLTFAANIALPLSPTLSSGSGFEPGRESVTLDEMAVECAQHATGANLPYEESATGGAAGLGPIPRLAVPQLEEPHSRWSVATTNSASLDDKKGAQQQQQRPPSPTKSSFLGRMTPKRERANTYTTSRTAIEQEPTEGGDGRDALGVPGQTPQKRSRLMSLLAKLSPRPDLPSMTPQPGTPPVPALPEQYATMYSPTPDNEKADPFARAERSTSNRTATKKTSLASLRQSFSMSRASFASNRNAGVLEEEVPPLPRPSMSSMRPPRASMGGASYISGMWVPEDAEMPPMPQSATSGTFVYPPVTSPTTADMEATPTTGRYPLPSPTKSTSTVLTGQAATVNLNSGLPEPSPARSSFDLLAPPQTPSSISAPTPTPTLASMSTPNLTPTPTPTSTSFSHVGLVTPTSGLGHSGARNLGAQGSYTSLASQGSNGSNGSPGSGSSKIPSAVSMRGAPSKGALVPPAIPVPALPPKEEKAPNRGLSLFGRKNRTQAKSSVAASPLPAISTTAASVPAATVTSPTSRIGAPATGLPKPRARGPPPPLNLSLVSPWSASGGGTGALPARSAVSAIPAASGPHPSPPSTVSPPSPPGPSSPVQAARFPPSTETTTKSKIGAPTLSKIAVPPSGKFASAPAPPSKIALPPPPARLLAVQQQRQQQQQQQQQQQAQQQQSQQQDEDTSPGQSPLTPPPVPPKNSAIPSVVPRLTTQRSSPRLQQPGSATTTTGRLGMFHGSRSEASLLSTAATTREKGLPGAPLKTVDEMGMRAGEKDGDRTITTNNGGAGVGVGGGKTMLPVPKKSFWRRG